MARTPAEEQLTELNLMLAQGNLSRIQSHIAALGRILQDIYYLQPDLFDLIDHAGSAMSLIVLNANTAKQYLQHELDRCEIRRQLLNGEARSDERREF